jgi:three-Cys-motif partner protein
VSSQRYDEIGYWSEVKLDIIRDYAKEYSKILAKRRRPEFFHLYVDGFAGRGVHVSKRTGQFIKGSPLNALLVEPPFREFHFIDLDGGRAEALRRAISNRPNVHVYEGDCNQILLSEVFPRCRREDYRRALCLLDPYSLNVNWDVLQTGGTMGSIEIFYNFMIMDANMNVFWHEPDKVPPAQRDRMDAVWGDRSWRDAAYRKERDLFGEKEIKAENEAVVQAFRQRLKSVAGFKYVPDPMPMRNSKGAVVYYLFFASPNETGEKIVKAIFQKYLNKGVA